MFGNIIGMIDNYDDRKVKRDVYDWGFISTCAVSDGRLPYETAVGHRDYNDGSMVIVEAYASFSEAEKGHARWVERMTAETLPESLAECANSEIQQLLEVLSDRTMVYPRKQKRPV